MKLYYERPILITGCARSGTSFIAKSIHLCGGFGGDVDTKGNRYNPHGMYENRHIVDRLVKPFLRAIQTDPMGQFPLPDINHIVIQQGNGNDWRKKVLSIFIEQGLQQHQLWYYKGAKICLFWPLWHRAFPDAKWIIVRRSDEGIVSSCLRTSFMRAYDGRSGWQYWVDVHKSRFEEMYKAKLQIKEVWPSKMIETNDFTEIKEIVEWCGLEYNEKAVKNSIDKSCWHYREKIGVNK